MLHEGTEDTKRFFIFILRVLRASVVNPLAIYGTADGDVWVAQDGAALLKFARPMADGSGQLLVIQLATQDQSVLVVMQILKTHQPIQAVSTAAAGATPPAEEAPETPGTGSSATLPDGLPVYPGAQVILQNSQMLMCQAAAPLDQVARYYQDQMASAGWSLTDSNSVGTVSTQKWEKGDASVMVIMTFQNDQTQIVISPQ